jgi:hypothetical protein
VASPDTTPPARRHPVQARLDAALAAWRGLGLPVGAVQVGRDGSVRVEAPVDRPADPAHDDRKPDPWT